jgi:hypothetical protein
VTIKGITLFRVFVSGVLSIVTLTAIDRFAGGSLRDSFAMPGGVIGSIGSMVGLYDMPSGAWAMVCIGGNFVFYATLWWVILWLVARLSSMAKAT